VDQINVQNFVPGPAGAAQALAHLPGVSLFDDQGSRVQPTLDVRGFTASPVVGVPQGVSVFLDGVRINEPDAQEVNFDLIPMDAIARAELVRGPATLFGKNALAGALVLVTKRGDSTTRVNGSLQGGAFGYRGANVTASGVLSGIDAFLLARGTEEDGYREDTPARTRMVFLNLGRKRDSTDLAFTVLYAHDRVSQAGSLPESWLAVNRSLNFTPGDFFLPDLWHFALRGERPFAGGALRGNVFYRSNIAEQFNVNIGTPSTDGFTNNTSAGGAAEWSLPLALAGKPLALTIGGEYSRNDVKYRIFQRATPSAPIESDCDPTTGLCENARVYEDDAALYGQAQLQANSWLTLTASARGDYVHIPFRDLTTPENDGTNTYWRFSPRVGVNYQVSNAFRGYAAVGTGFRSPAALELACASEESPCALPFSLGSDPRLEPVTAIDYETGIDWEPFEGASLDVVGFREDVRNEILFVASTVTAGFFRNIPRTRRQGVEMNASYSLPAGLTLHGAYSLIDATYQSTVLLASALPEPDSAHPGDQFPLTPRHRGAVGLGITRAIGAAVLTGDLSTRFVSSQFMRGNDVSASEITLPDGRVVSGRIPAYNTTDLRLRYERQRWAISAHVSNLFDQRYVTYGIFGENPLGPLSGPAPAEPLLERFLTPGYPFAVTLGLELKY